MTKIFQWENERAIEQAKEILPTTGRSWNEAAYARLAIPMMDVFRGYDRVIWVDSDIDIQSDMFSGVLSVETSKDGLAGCVDGYAGGGYMRKQFPWYSKSKDQYANSGLMVMDLYKIDVAEWKKRVSEGLDIDRRSRLRLPDQDILNAYFDINIIDARYNVLRTEGKDYDWAWGLHYVNRRGKKDLYNTALDRKRHREDLAAHESGMAQAFSKRFRQEG